MSLQENRNGKEMGAMKIIDRAIFHGAHFLPEKPLQTDATAENTISVSPFLEGGLLRGRLGKVESGPAEGGGWRAGLLTPYCKPERTPRFLLQGVRRGRYMEGSVEG